MIGTSVLFIDDLGSMEPEDRPRGDADSVARNSAENQRAGRQAWPVDNDTLARAPDLREEVLVVADRAAWARQNAHIGKRRRQSGQAQGNSKHEMAHGEPIRLFARFTSCGGLLRLGLWLGSWRALWLGSWRATPKEHLHLRLCNLPVLVGIDPLENFCMGRLEFLERQSPIAISIH